MYPSRSLLGHCAGTNIILVDKDLSGFFTHSLPCSQAHSHFDPLLSPQLSEKSSNPESFICMKILRPQSFEKARVKSKSGSDAVDTAIRDALSKVLMLQLLVPMRCTGGSSYQCKRAALRSNHVCRRPYFGGYTLGGLVVSCSSGMRRVIPGKVIMEFVDLRWLISSTQKKHGRFDSRGKRSLVSPTIRFHFDTNTYPTTPSWTCRPSSFHNEQRRLSNDSPL